ncbi:MAG TPA: heme biosynthesis HemY N-terminal domain-containing protein [Moraxellaceae bacterium]|nr:heme biosynthesis HemY N-terminal domain-containing protein [Moraxellaceae bacterium]
MRQALFLSLILLGLGAVLGLWLLHDPGYVLVSRGSTSVEMNLWVGLALWGLSVLAMLVAVELFVRLLGLGGWWARWTGQRQLQRSARNLQDGVVALEKGEWQRAERLLFSAARQSPQPLPAWLAAARAALRADAVDRAEQYLVLAEERGNRLAVGLARARLLMASGRWEQAAALLARLQDRFRKEGAVLRLRLEVLTRLQKWGELAELLPQLRRNKDADSRSEALEKRACREVLAWLGQAASRADRSYTVGRLRTYWDGLPRHLRQDEEMGVAFAEQLIRIGADDEAEALLAAMLDRDWNPAAIEAYGRTRSTRPDQALARARSWEEKHPHNPVLLLALGRLSLQNRQWEAARHYFEATLALRKSSEAYAELVRLLSRLAPSDAGPVLVASVEAGGLRLPDLPLP